MQIHKYIKRGLNHANYCEDFILHESISDKYELFGVFDGCSSGIDSHFASVFIAKIVSAEFHKLANKLNLSNIKFLKKLLFKTIKKLKKQKKVLNLNQNQLLSTIILFLYNKPSNCGIIISIGDGIISINGTHTEIDEDNVPDYLAYHLDDINSKADFEKWHTVHSRNYIIDDIQDLSISTDGAASFVKTANSNKEEGINPLDYLFKDDFLIKNKAMLARKCNILERKYGLVNADDLGIIRVIK